jgi:catechol 2,3-dioxygenase-like lactoylglutathione lyase family enzyme
MAIWPGGIHNTRISMITLGVRDLASSVKFYEQGLGFPRSGWPSLGSGTQSPFLGRPY